MSLDFVSVFGHLIGYEDIYKCDPERRIENDHITEMLTTVFKHCVKEYTVSCNLFRFSYCHFMQSMSL